ncbi:MAG: tail fiber domain-containing protein, partial [Flavobacterium sp.]
GGGSNVGSEFESVTTNAGGLSLLRFKIHGGGGVNGALLERMRIVGNGNVGINTDNPLDRLHVVGNIRMVDGNQALGRVMKSNANGTATWQEDNDNQTIALTGNNLSILNGNSVNLSGINTDNQTLSLTGNSLSILNGNSVNLASINTDNQTLSLTGNNLSILNGNSVNLTSLNTDNQTLSLTGTNLSIAGGNTVNLSSLSQGADNGLGLVVGNIGLGGSINRATTVALGTFGINFNMNSTGDFNVQDAGTTVFSVQDNGNAYFANRTSFGKTTNPLYVVDIEDTNNTSARGINISKTDNSNFATNGVYVDKTGNGSGNSHAIYNQVTGSGTGQKYGVFNQLNSNADGNQYAVRNWIRGNTNSSVFGLFNNIDNASTGAVYGVYNGLRNTASNQIRGLHNEFDVTVSATEITGIRNQISNGIAGIDGFNGVFNVMLNNNNGTYYGNRTEYTTAATGGGVKYGTYNLISSSAGGTHFGTFNSVSVANGWAGYFLGRNYISDRLSIGITDNPNAGLNIDRNSTDINAHIELTQTGGSNSFSRIRFNNSAETTNDWVVAARANNDSSLSRFNIFHNGTGNILRIYGDGKIGIMRNPVTNALEVEGNASKSIAGNWIGNSDLRLKKEIQTLDPKDALEKVLNLRGITYLWNDDKTGTQRPKELQMGFIAQEIAEVFPEKVTEDNLGYLQTAYGDYDPIVFQAIKALNDKIENLEKENQKLHLALQRIEALEVLLKTPTNK